MDIESKNVCEIFDRQHLVEKNWRNDDLGLSKKCISYNYKSMAKASDCSKCFVRISNVECAPPRQSNYLSQQQEWFWIEIGAAECPIDICIEHLLQKMMSGETSKCGIQTKNDERIEFIIELSDVKFGGYLFELSPKDLYAYAKRLKDAGVKMFKQWPRFAHDNFNRAFKCLHTIKPFTEMNEEISTDQLQQLYDKTISNIAACLLIEQRYEDALDVLTEINADNRNCQQMEKILYRRALAHFHLKQFDEAKNELEKMENFRLTKEFVQLHDNIATEMKKYNDTYASMVKKMFG